MVIGLWYTHDPNFSSLSWFWRCKEHPCPLSQHLGLWRTLEVPDWGLASLSWFGYGIWSLIQLWSKCWLSILILKVQRTFSPHLELWRNLEIPDLGLASWSWFSYNHWSLIHSCSKFWPSILILKVQRTTMSFKSRLQVLRMLEVPEWGLASWSWFEYIQEPCLDLPWSFDQTQFS